MSKPRLVLGNKNYSSWSLRPYLGIVHAGIEFDELVLQLDTPEFQAQIGEFNSAGKVPVLIDGTTRIWDSLAILEYLAEAEPSLWPEDRQQRAHARSISAEMHSGFQALRSACPMNIRATDRQIDRTPALDRDIERIQTIWSTCLSASKGPYLFGRFSCADAMFAPVASRFKTYDIALEPTAQAYVTTIHNDPAFKRWEAAALAETEIVEADEAGARRIS